MTDIDAKIRAKVGAFARELTALFRKAVLDAIATSLAASLPSPRGAGAHRGGATGAGRATRKTRRRRAGAKRDPKIIANPTARLAAHVAAHPGQGIRQIGKALGASTQDLALPTKKLLAGKRIKKRGTRSETRYFPS